MGQGKVTAWMVRAIWLAAAFTLAMACSPSSPPGENVGEARSAVFTNGGFETGAAGTAPAMPWVVQTFLNNATNGITVQTPQTLPGLNLGAGGKPLTTIIASATGPLTQLDPDLGAGASLRWPRYGNQCARVNFHSSTNFMTNGSNNGQNVNALSQTMTIGPGDVDAVDHKVHVRFVVAPVLQNPAHAASLQPYYLVQLTDVTTNTLLYSDFNLSGNPGVPWQKLNANTANEVDYTDWQLVDISPSGANLAMGDMVLLEVIAAGCQPGGHFGEIYIDGAATATLPGLFVFGTAAAQANPCTDLTYTLTYENGGTTPAAGVTVTFNTPPQTTFVSLNAPGLNCTTPAAGAAGLVTCTIGNLAAGAGGSFQVTVNIACTATGTITAGNYAIQGTGIEPLLGSHVNTTIGCTVDSVCPAGDWCFESMNLCTPTLPNKTPIPSDGPHTNPTLNGNCTAAAGALVCTSGVCDATNNECGYANGDGPCTAATGDIVCQSVVCDTDGKCGYANGDGPCTPGTGVSICRSTVCDTDNKCGYANGDGPCTPGTTGNGGTVCRSTICGSNGECEPPGFCAVDADCPMGQWCDETMHTCSPKLPNGSPVPTDTPHTMPTLNGTCTTAAGTLVCVSGVCDTKDNACGYANGDGPCTGTTGDVVCRSTICATMGPNQGNCVACAMDSQCSGTTSICDPTTNTCVQCTTSTQCSGATPVCDLTGTCVAGCLTDANCTSDDWCNAPLGGTGTCVPKIANGNPLPSMPSDVATCSATVGMRVCVSGVCDPKDNACGYANGDGPCSSESVCRSDDCDITTKTCVGPDAGTPKLPDGAMCATSDQCESGHCIDGVCSEGIIGSGNGLICTVRAAGGSGGDEGALAVFGIMLAAAGLRRRRGGARAS